MKLEKHRNNEIVGAIVMGSKPWNMEYNVGLVVDQVKANVATYKIMWMNPRDKISGDDFLLPMSTLSGKVVYTWEHLTSIDVLSRIDNRG
tara:strand:- start:192 stop:461 length:270 start_codon:yes stop_codon:yes gene_type:complete